MMMKLRNWIDIRYINWYSLMQNKNPEAIKFLKQNPKKIDWTGLSWNKNPDAIKFLKQNPKKIDWTGLSYNKNPEAIELLKQNLDKINWINLYWNENPEAIELFKQNPDKIDWIGLSRNSSIFSYDYEAIEKIYRSKNECIEQYMFNPKHVDEFLTTHDVLEEDIFVEWFKNRYVC